MSITIECDCCGTMKFTSEEDADMHINDALRAGIAVRVVRDPGINPLPLSEKNAQFEHDVAKVFDAAQQLLLRKHADYGPRNISDSPGGPLNGLRVRMFDKIARLNNLVDSGAEPENESLRDTLVDLANYALIGILVLDGSWPE